MFCARRQTDVTNITTTVNLSGSGSGSGGYTGGFHLDQHVVLRCDPFYLLITQKVLLRAMVAPGTRTFVCPPRHRACIIFILI